VLIGAWTYARRMSLVHVFVSTGRFASEKDVRDYIEPAYSTDGDVVPSRFIREIHLDEFEPACIEAVHSSVVVPVRELLRDASWASQWITQLDPEQRADSAICVFPPNLVAAPRASSLEYCGAFTYVASHA
jgi:hypothetical protein